MANLIKSSKLYWKLDEIANNTVLDSSGNNNNGRVIGTSTVTSGYDGKGKARKLGSQNALFIDSVLSGNSNFTLSSWIKLDSVQGSDNAIYQFYLLGVTKKNGYGVAIGMGLYNTLSISYLGSDHKIEKSTEKLLINKWYHIALTKQGSVCKLYLDGVEVLSTSSITYDVGTSFASCYVNTVNASYNAVTGSTYDEIMVFEKTLTPQEIFRVYKGQFSENKTLILHDGEYKKWNEGIDEVVKEVNLVPIMTSNTLPHGVVKASAEYNTQFGWKAFDNDATTYWYGYGVAAPTGGHWLEYTFTEPQSIVKVALKTRVIGGANTHGIKNFKIWGTNDGINFTELLSEVFPNSLLLIEYALKKEEKYLTYRIQGNSYLGAEVLVEEFKLYKKVEVIPRTPPSWSSVSDFQLMGMDSLPPLLDRKVTTLEPLPMLNKSDILLSGEEGKVFSKTLDLKKYMDIRSVKVEVK